MQQEAHAESHKASGEAANGRRERMGRGLSGEGSDHIASSQNIKKEMM